MGGSSGSSKQTSTNEIPAEMKGLTSQTAGRVGEIQNYAGMNPADYQRAHPTNVPEMSQNQWLANYYAPKTADMTGGEQAAYGSLGNAGAYAGQSSMPYASQSGLATGADLAADPSIAAAYNAYKTQAEPGIQNQYGLMGLGKSTSMGDATAKGAAGYMFPAIQQSLAREQSANEARIGREMGASEAQTGRQTSTALNTAAQQAGLGTQEMNRRLAGLNALSTTGATMRGVEGEKAGAEQSDFLRRQALAEQGTYGVLGQLPSSFGSQVKSSSGASK